MWLKVNNLGRSFTLVSNFFLMFYYTMSSVDNSNDKWFAKYKKYKYKYVKLLGGMTAEEKNQFARLDAEQAALEASQMQAALDASLMDEDGKGEEGKGDGKGDGQGEEESKGDGKGEEEDQTIHFIPIKDNDGQFLILLDNITEDQIKIMKKPPKGYEILDKLQNYTYLDDSEIKGDKYAVYLKKYVPGDLDYKEDGNNGFNYNDLIKYFKKQKININEYTKLIYDMDLETIINSQT